MRYRPHNSTGIGSEAELQMLVCDYLRIRYPNAIWRSDFSSGMKLTIAQASRQKRLQSSRGFPDMFVYEARHGHHGLALELKRPGAKLYKKDGTLVSDRHLEEQAEMLDRLRERGYEAHFTQSFEDARSIIDRYLGDGTEPLFENF